jgi:hypothetical protein
MNASRRLVREITLGSSGRNDGSTTAPSRDELDGAITDLTRIRPNFWAFQDKYPKFGSNPVASPRNRPTKAESWRFVLAEYATLCQQKSLNV